MQLAKKNIGYFIKGPASIIRRNERSIKEIESIVSLENGSEKVL
jgi:hypothetical protein